MLDPARRAKIIDKIAALKARRVEAGASEQEADTALKIAAELMRAYQIEDTDIAAARFDRSEIKIKGMNTDLGVAHAVVFCSSGISRLTGSHFYITSHGSILAVGDEVGREMAAYLYDVLYRAIENSWKAERAKRRELIASWWDSVFREPPPARIPASYNKSFREYGLALDRQARRSFHLGVAMRVNDRMMAMPPARRVPNHISERIMRDMEPMKREKKGESLKIGDDAAFLSGTIAGDGIPISMGVSDRSSPVYQLEKKDT